MRELKHDELRMRLSILLTTAPKYAKNALTDPRHRIVDHLMERLFDGVVLVSPSFAGHSRHDGPIHGRFGVTEPHPVDLEAEVVQLRAELAALKNGPT